MLLQLQYIVISEAQTQRAALDARRATKKEECCGNPFKCKGNCVDKEQRNG